MDHLYRIIRNVSCFLFGVFLSFVLLVSSSYAAGWSGYTYDNPTATAACNSWVGHYGVTQAMIVVTYVSDTRFTCGTGVPDATLVGPGCTAPLVLDHTTGACVSPCPAAGSAVSGVTGNSYSGTNVGGLPASVCINGCAYFSGSGFSSRPSNIFSTTVGKSKGASCTAADIGVSSVTPFDPNTTQPPTPQSCLAAGKSFITMNSVTVCLNSGAPGAAQTTQTAAKSKATTTNGGPQQTTTTTTTTEITDSGTVQQTTTTTNPDGTVDTKKEEKDKKTFCEENPTIAMCKESAWGGSCGSFQCNGDAVQCAIAREQHERDCTLYDRPTSLSDLGNAVASGNDPQASTFPQNSPVTYDAASTFQAAQGARWLGSADLPAVSITALGHSYSFDTGPLSNFLRAIGYVLVAVAGVIAVRIVGTGG